MAKKAKQQDVEITPRVVNGPIKQVFEALENIESARGKYMNVARRQRELIAVIYEGLAQKGVPQNVAKLQVEIERLQIKLRGKIADLEMESRKILQRIGKARDNKAQLALFADLPPAPKATLDDAADEAEERRATRKQGIIGGDELKEAEAAGTA